MTIVNDGRGNDKTGHYDCAVYINKDRLAQFRVKNYDRSKGWEGLILECAKAIKKKEIEYTDTATYLLQEYLKTLESAS